MINGSRPRFEGVLLTPPHYPALSLIEHASGTCLRVQTSTALGQGQILSTQLLSRAANGIAMLRRLRIGGTYWAQPARLDEARSAPVALLAPSTLADAGNEDLAQIERMIAAAQSFGSRHVVALTHGLKATPRRRIEAAARLHGWAIVDHDVDPWSLIEHAGVVLTNGAIVGFLALLSGVQVRCFGDCFYSGWGPTDDDAAVNRHTIGRSIEEIFAAAVLMIPRYRDPFHDRPGGFEEMCGILAEWRRQDAFNRSIAACLGMSFWKRRQIRAMLRSVDGSPICYRSPRLALRRARRFGGAIAVWASREPQALAEAAAAALVPVVRVEDGFLRSVGLGADFVPAASIIMDTKGIYYDPTGPSDFMDLATTSDFAPEMLDRARELIRLLVDRGITKYNTGRSFPKLDIASKACRIFVPGQVEDDRSVLAAGAGVKGNLDLLRRVRTANPNAYIIYKPHPDVDAGHRQGAVADAAVKELADLIVRDVSSAELIRAIDEVHTLTSLAGFEALLRGCKVVVYGQPFYAGWGLTRDMAPPIIGRARRLTLEELVAVTLIFYPRYLDPVTKLPCGPEVIIERLGQQELWRPGMLVQLRKFHGVIAGTFRRYRAVLRNARVA